GVGPEMLARRYTDEAISWMKSQPRGKRFFSYIAHRSPHLPNYVAPPFAGRSRAGLYGDVIEELDSTVGDVMKALVDMGVDQNTIVVFTSDNGPAIPPGSAGGLYRGKGPRRPGG